MDKKLSSKFDALQGLPSGLARQIEPARKRFSDTNFVADPDFSVAIRIALAQGKSEVTRQALSKAQKVKAWREANPEAYAQQKRRNAEKQAKKRELAK